MMSDDDDGQVIFGDLGGLKLPDICLTGEEKPRKYLTQETCPDRGLNPGPLRDRRACYHLSHSDGLKFSLKFLIFIFFNRQKSPARTSTRKLTLTEIEPWPAGREATTLPLGHSGGQVAALCNLQPHSSLHSQMTVIVFSWEWAEKLINMINSAALTQIHSQFRLLKSVFYQLLFFFPP